jgi:transcriptional regulator with XRE-family HTH domain
VLGLWTRRRGKRRQEKLGEKLRAIRQRLQLEDELDRTYISTYERGLREPPLYVILKYAQVAGVSTDLIIDDQAALPRLLPSTPNRKT